jgi:ABC-2 type transport system ATP-binding protein
VTQDAPTTAEVERETAAAVRVRGLVKRYGDLAAVDGIDFEARRGQCLGILGPNGAGKTTTIEILEGLKHADEGEVEILGMRWATDAERIRQRMGVQLQETELTAKITVAETLRLFRSFYRERRDLEEVLALVDLGEKRDARVDQLSGGQKQRLALGCALVNRPEVLFLDEPTTGLDPRARRRVWKVVEDIVAEGGTVLLTTHYMEEAERLAHDLVIVDRGRVVARGSPAEIIGRLEAESVVELVPSPASGGAAALDPTSLGGLPGIVEVRRESDSWILTVTETHASMRAIFRHLEERGVELLDLRAHRPTLEDVFVSMTGHHLRDE